METLIARQLDEKRRLVMPDEVPPGTAVTLQQVDKETWMVRVHHPASDYRIIAIPVVDELPDDPEWDKTEERLGRAAYRKLPPPGE